jgi:hypothetical protein
VTAAGCPDARRTDRYEAPAYLARYQQRRGTPRPAGAGEGGAGGAGAGGGGAGGAGAGGAGGDDGTPLYLRRFRERKSQAYAAPDLEPGPGLDGPATPELVSYEGQTFTPELAEVTRGKEIAAPLERRTAEQIIADISIIRHGITQGYSADAGLTPMGAWQAHRRGHELARRVNDGEQVRIVCADTGRARQTADQLYRGMTDGLVLFGLSAEVS